MKFSQALNRIGISIFSSKSFLNKSVINIVNVNDKIINNSITTIEKNIEKPLIISKIAWLFIGKTPKSILFLTIPKKIETKKYIKIIKNNFFLYILLDLQRF